MRVEQSQHQQREDLQGQPAVQRDLHAGSRGDPSAEEIRDDPKELVEQKQERDGNTVVAELVEMQDDQHPQRAVGDREAPVGSRHQRVAANAVHERSSRRGHRCGSCAATFRASSTIRFT